MIKDFDSTINNWHYKELKDNQWVNVNHEDIMHLCSMYFCFDKIIEYSIGLSISISDSKMILLFKSFNNKIKKDIIKIVWKIKNNIKINTKLSSIGWHYPWILYVIHNSKHKKLIEYWKNICLSNKIVNHNNYRVKSQNCFILSSIYC